MCFYQLIFIVYFIYSKIQINNKKGKGLYKLKMPNFKFPKDQSYYNTSNRVKFIAYQPTTTSPVGEIDLFTPIGFTLGDNASYGDFKMGAITGATNEVVKNAVDAFKNSSNNMFAPAAAIGSLGNDIAGIASSLSLKSGAELMVDAFGSQRIKDLFTYNARSVVNPNTHTLFNSIGIRKFSFAFSLAASNKEESDEINGIVKFFREYLYPDITTSGMILEFPVFWKILFHYQNKENEYMPILHDAFLDSFSSNYNPDTNSWHADGSPVSISFNLSFVESKALNRKSIFNRDYKDFS